jgi:hypothetical protein
MPGGERCLAEALNDGAVRVLAALRTMGNVNRSGPGE